MVKVIAFVLSVAGFGYTAAPVMLPDDIGTITWFACYVSTVLAMGIIFSVGFLHWIQDDIR